MAAQENLFKGLLVLMTLKCKGMLVINVSLWKMAKIHALFTGCVSCSLPGIMCSSQLSAAVLSSARKSKFSFRLITPNTCQAGHIEPRTLGNLWILSIFSMATIRTEFRSFSIEADHEVIGQKQVLDQCVLYCY